MLLSLAVARLITPMIAAYFLKAHGEAVHGEGWLMDRYMGVLRWSLDTRASADYAARHPSKRGRFVARLLDHRVWTMGFAGLAFALTILSFATLPMSFQPSSNTDYSQVSIEMVPGSTLEQTRQMALKVADVLADDKDTVEAAFTDIEQPGKAEIFLTLKKSRKVTSVEWERQMAPRFQQIPDGRVNFQSQSGGGFGRDVIIMLGSDRPDMLEATANTLVKQMAGMKELRDARVQGDLQRPEILVKPRMGPAELVPFAS